MDLGSCQKKVLIIIFINLARFVTAITAIYLYGAFLIVENTGNELVICLLIIRCLFSLLFVCFISYNDIITEEDSDSDFYSLSTVVVDDNIRRELGELRIRELSLEYLNLEDLRLDVLYGYDVQDEATLGGGEEEVDSVISSITMDSATSTSTSAPATSKN